MSITRQKRRGEMNFGVERSSVLILFIPSTCPAEKYITFPASPDEPIIMSGLVIPSLVASAYKNPAPCALRIPPPEHTIAVKSLSCIRKLYHASFLHGVSICWETSRNEVSGYNAHSWPQSPNREIKDNASRAGPRIRRKGRVFGCSFLRR